MEVKIGVIHASRELTLDTTLDAGEVEAQVLSALTDGGVLSLADAKGRRVVVPAEKLAYVEITTSTAGQVGFRSSVTPAPNRVPPLGDGHRRCPNDKEGSSCSGPSS